MSMADIYIYFLNINVFHFDIFFLSKMLNSFSLWSSLDVREVVWGRGSGNPKFNNHTSSGRRTNSLSDETIKQTSQMQSDLLVLNLI